MGRLAIYGGKPLRGELLVQGSKNAALPILAATLLTEEECEIQHCPDLSDVSAAIEILKTLGAKVDYDGETVYVSPRGVHCFAISEPLALKMRSSVMFLGPILNRCGKASIGYPGGCALGERPINLHLQLLRELGVIIREENWGIHGEIKGFQPQRLSLPFPSVGATENVMMFCARSQGVTELYHPAKEPEIVDLQQFLNSMGARISGAGTDIIRIEGVTRLHGSRYRVMPDRIAAATYLCGAVACGGVLTLNRTVPEHMEIFLEAVKRMGAEISCMPNQIRADMNRRSFGAGRVQTAPYPGFPTDMQPLLMAASLKAAGTTVFEETIFENRLCHAKEFLKLGAEITVENQTAAVRGVPTLSGAQLRATDLRGGAALAIAALSAEGRSEIDGLCYIQRGYEHFTETLRMLGADAEEE